MEVFSILNIAPDEHTHHHMIEMYCRAKRLPKALEWFAALKRTGLKPRNDTYGILVDALARANLIEDSLAVLDEYKTKYKKVHERHVRLLRIRCEQLKIAPLNDLVPENPNKWRNERKRDFAKNMRRKR